MSTEDCPHAAATVESTRTGRWDESLRAHVDTCSECAESVRVAAWMTRAATDLLRDPPALDPTFIWLTAEVERRAEETSGASRHALGALVMRGLAPGLAGAAAALLISHKLSPAASAVRDWVLGNWAAASLADLTIIVTLWLELPLLLAAIYLLVLRPSR
jgi:hypothetical protein